MPTDVIKKPPSPQQFRQKSSTRFGTYSLAKAAFDRLGKNVRKRIRRRKNPIGVFDVVVYEKIKKEENQEGNEQEASE